MIKFNCGDNGSNYVERPHYLEPAHTWPGGATAASITIKKMNSVAQ